MSGTHRGVESGAHKGAPVRRPNRRRPAIVAVLATVLVVSGSLAAVAAVGRGDRAPDRAAETGPGYGMFAADLVPDSAVDSDTSAATLGVSFSSSVAGVVTAVEVYRGRGGAVPEDGALWSSSGRRLATAEFAADPGTGWVRADLSTPVRLRPGARYVASYDAPRGRYAGDNWQLDADDPVAYRALTAWQGVYTRVDDGFPTQRYQDSNYYVDVVFVPDGSGPTTTPTPTPTDDPTDEPTVDPTDPTDSPTVDPTDEPTADPTDEPTVDPTEPTGGPSEEPTEPTGSPTPTDPTTSPTPTDPTTSPTVDPDPDGFPDAASTGVPAGTQLTPYTGPCTITAAGTVIEAKTVDCSLTIRAPGVVIRDSVINGTVGNEENAAGRSFTITDSEVRVGNRPGTGIGSRDFVATRVEVTGGNRSVNCWMSCTIRDSWVHGQFRDDSGVYHESGIRMGAGSTIVGNTIVCDAPDVPPDAGCSAGLTGYGDFAAVRDVLVQGNLFPPSTGGACAYGGSSGGKPFSALTASVRFIDNVFVKGRTGKCGAYAPVLDFNRSAPGNVWSGNVWQDGGEVRP